MLLGVYRPRDLRIFLSQGYSIFSTLYFALAASPGATSVQPSAAVEQSHPPLGRTDQYRANALLASCYSLP